MRRGMLDLQIPRRVEGVEKHKVRVAETKMFADVFHINHRCFSQQTLMPKLAPSLFSTNIKQFKYTL